VLLPPICQCRRYLVESAVADALAKQQALFASMLSEKVSSVIAQVPVPGKSLSVAAEGTLSDQGGALGHLLLSHQAFVGRGGANGLWRCPGASRSDRDRCSHRLACQEVVSCARRIWDAS
jgi:hypothetical protein